jgi:hypothetical protein
LAFFLYFATAKHEQEIKTRNLFYFLQPDLQLLIFEYFLKTGMCAVANGKNGTNGKAAYGNREEASIESINMLALVCSLENKDNCMMCGS